jgi:hypothetical protein
MKHIANNGHFTPLEIAKLFPGGVKVKERLRRVRMRSVAPVKDDAFF